jgi:hypothetical protein
MRQLPAPRSRVLILIAGEISGRSLARELADRGERPAATSVVIIAPAPMQAATARADDIDVGIAEAERKVDDLVALLRNQGYKAIGKVGDLNPVRAIEDGLAEFPSKGVIVATHQGRRMELLASYLVDLLTRETHRHQGRHGSHRRPCNGRSRDGFPPESYATEPFTGRRQKRGHHTTSMSHQPKE